MLGALLLLIAISSSASVASPPSGATTDVAVANVVPDSDALIGAAEQGDLDAAQSALDQGADINGRRAGLTAWHAANIAGQQDLADYLAAHGADTNTPFPTPATVIDACLNELIHSNSPGVAVLVARDGKVLFEKGWGCASIEHAAPFTPETKSRIGSVTKQFTAAAILRLQEQGKLSVNDKLGKFIPDFPRGNEVTLHHLLTHTSGIHNYTAKPGFLETATIGTKPEDLIASFRKDPYDFVPGEKQLYSNSGYFLLGYIVEKVSGRSFQAFLNQEFFAPLGMTNTGVHTPTAVLPHEASGYILAGGKVTKALNWDMSRAGGAGALYSTVEDLYRWNEGVFNGKVLSAVTLEAAFTPVVTKVDAESTKDSGYGYGWVISRIRGLRVIAHGGGLHGFLTHLLRYPEQRLTVVVLANATDPPWELMPHALASRIAQLYLWREMQPRKTFTPVRIAPADLDAFVGRYNCNGPTLTVTRKGGRLFAQIDGQPKFGIYPKAQDTFFWRVSEAEVRFVRNAKGAVVEGIHRQNGQTLHAPRLADEQDGRPRMRPYVFGAVVVVIAILAFALLFFTLLVLVRLVIALLRRGVMAARRRRDEV